MNKGLISNPQETPGPMPGLARAWVKFKWNGAQMVIFAEYNVRAVVHNGAGDYTIYFKQPFTHPHYCCVAMASTTTTGNTSSACVNNLDTASAGSKRIMVQQTGAGNTDESEVHFVAWGEQ